MVFEEIQGVHEGPMAKYLEPVLARGTRRSRGS
jgi:hypothetical protein